MKYESTLKSRIVRPINIPREGAGAVLAEPHRGAGGRDCRADAGKSPKRSHPRVARHFQRRAGSDAGGARCAVAAHLPHTLGLQRVFPPRASVLRGMCRGSLPHPRPLATRKPTPAPHPPDVPCTEQHDHRDLQPLNSAATPLRYNI